jgi:hypothetical protein
MTLRLYWLFFNVSLFQVTVLFLQLHPLHKQLFVQYQIRVCQRSLCTFPGNQKVYKLQ